MVSLDIGAPSTTRGGRRRPSCAPLAAGEPPWPGPRLPSGPGVGFVDRGGGQPRLARVHCWGVRNKLRFAPSKTNSMVLTKKLKYDDPVVHMNGERISSVGEIRLLGLTIDKKLTFIPHVAKACKKATNIYKGLARAAKATWGLSRDHIPLP
ncbi:Putative 115 kDa protein in type-1 retrotransposable element R1DM [Eumeta japonica]|uniref:115 kDa protein in type-1 retrotransposable element R1DM n=1 Tax=Eumeta variegata TaxID=151549 RepID=A0A4C1UW03_EUMVA|nr:Putative 115 kDa protein in type-1 retrotransposable element R1DM [Eumeta japonica]